MGDTAADCPAPAVVRDLLGSDFERVARDGYLVSVVDRNVRVYRERAVSRTPDGSVRVTGELVWQQPIPDAREAVDRRLGGGVLP